MYQNEIYDLASSIHTLNPVYSVMVQYIVSELLVRPSFLLTTLCLICCVKEYIMQSQSRSMMPVCIKNEKPLLVTTQVKLVDPADEYVTIISCFL